MNNILAGPMLRRCDSHQVNIWLATSSAPQQLAATVLQDANLLSRSTVKTVKLGDKLYISLITAHPQAGTFPTAQLLNYDVNLDGKNLQQLGLLSGRGSLAYPGQALPSFFLPNADANSAQNILHGSCRKLHGDDKDALAIADLEIAQHLNDLDKRPSVLLLTGDQIYADDVAAPLIKHLSQLAETLSPHEPAVPGMPYPLSEIAINRRHHLMSEQAGFTSGYAHNHLISFAEFSALYLLSWNGELWPKDYISDEEAIRDRVYQPFRISKKTNQARKKYREQLKQLKLNQRTLPQIRRLLANIPSYMIFDDHEVTDDWNIHAAWQQHVAQSPAGKRVVTNALAAYWAFQGWGNDPDSFDDGIINTLQDYFNTPTATVQQCDQLYSRLNQQQWSYLVPSHPAALVLDTRTQRNMAVAEGELPWLINPQALASMGAQISALNHQSPLMIVSAAPVMGLETIEEAQATFANWGVKAETLDFESWSASTAGLVQFFKQLHGVIAEQQTLIFLSGDVHYSFTMRGSFSWNNRTLHFKQITSSAQKNTGWANKKLMNFFSAWDHRRSFQGWDQPATSQRFEEIKHNPSQHLREFTEYPAILKQHPLMLSAKKAQEMQINEPSDWQINSEYLKANHGDDGYRIVGRNNLGCLSIMPDGTLSNRCITWHGNQLRSYLVMID